MGTIWLCPVQWKLNAQGNRSEGLDRREGCSVPSSCPNCSGPYGAAWLGCPECWTQPLANKTRSQTYIPYNHAIRQAKDILHNSTDSTANNRPTLLTRSNTPHMQTTLKTNNKQQHRKLSAKQALLEGAQHPSDKNNTGFTQTESMQHHADKNTQHAMHRTSADIHYTTRYTGHAVRWHTSS